MPAPARFPAWLCALLCASNLLLGAGSARAAAEDVLTIHLISASGEYQSEPSLQEFSTHLQNSYGIRCTASWGKDGVQELPELDKLQAADLLILFARRMKLSEKQMALIRAHWEAGKPVIGIRTAGHAFQQADNEVFDKQVLGGHYKGHYGGEAVKVENSAEQADHPVLKGVDPFTSRKLYSAGPLAADTIVLQTGDIGKAKHPVTIVHQYKGGRMFFTSLGVPEDFRDENFRRMLVNAIGWTTGRDLSKLKQ